MELILNIYKYPKFREVLKDMVKYKFEHKKYSDTDSKEFKNTAHQLQESSYITDRVNITHLEAAFVHTIWSTCKGQLSTTYLGGTLLKEYNNRYILCVMEYEGEQPVNLIGFILFSIDSIEDILEEEKHLQIVGNAKTAIGINTICSSKMTMSRATSEKGIGSKMLKELELYAVKQGINVIFVSAPTDDAKLWYTKKGFVQNDELYEYYDFWHKIIEP